MFSYLMLGTNDLDKAIAFYDPLMALLGHPQGWRNENGASWGTFSDNKAVGLCVGRPFDRQAATVGNGVMAAFNAPSTEAVRQLYDSALNCGGTSEGEPGYRPQYGEEFFSAYVRDPDGNKLAFVFYDLSRR